jgi:hypothetical protein
MHYQWLLFLDDVQLSAKIIHECPWWELQLLQLRFLLCEYIDCSKWQRCSWRLEMGGREVLTHTNCPSVIRPWMRQDVTDTPEKFTIYLHNENAVGDQFCSSELSFCIPMALLFAQLQRTDRGTPELPSDPKPLSKSLCDIRTANDKPQQQSRNTSVATRVQPSTRMPKPVSIPASQLGASVTTNASRPKLGQEVKFPLVHGAPPKSVDTPGYSVGLFPSTPSCPSPVNKEDSDSVCTIL